MEHYKNLSLENIAKKFEGIIYTEEWKDVAGYEGIYQISSFGRVKSLRRTYYLARRGARIVTEKILKQKTAYNGYLQVGLRQQGIKRKWISCHRLVMINFIGENQLQVNHIDGDKRNNYLENLEWCTHKENNNHAIKIGLVNNSGKNNPKAILTEKDVIEIREKYNSLSAPELSEMYGVKKLAIYRAVSKKSKTRSWSSL